MTFDVGALVKARGREWVVLPESNPEEDLFVLRPLGGTEDEVTGIYRPLESIEPAAFPLPDPARDMGNHLTCRLLRDAVRLGFRSGAGPFRSLACINVEPRPYQLVPLLMALKLDPVRLLIADDVGIGKTVEACLVARELIDRGEVQGMAVLCPPHLAEQWQAALARQFHIEAELVLSSTAARLERNCRQDESLFERYPFTIVSTDYIKSERRRYEFLRTCPELVIVDEAHTCASGPGRSVAQQRHELLRALINPEKDESARRHLILVTATPHSGNEGAFRSLLTLLNPDFAGLPDDLSGDENRRHRETLARHLVQRRRADLRAYLDTETPFPDRETDEDHYLLSPAYRDFMDRVLAFCRESVLEAGLEKRRQRVRWWSALALLRSISSSPAAAAATLRNRSATADAESVEEADEEGRRAVLDLDEENAEGIDVVPGSDSGEEEEKERRRLLRLAREAENLAKDDDAKLKKAAQLVSGLIKDEYSPIVFCRFIPTVEYVAEHLREALPSRSVHVEEITGTMPPALRDERIRNLPTDKQCVLVCTDCLSEGIDLQHHFDAVIHYDLSWNPTRHEQREGRVDRFGQRRKEVVRTVTFYGQDNPVDGVVLQVLLRKHKAIYKQLQVIVPVPMDTQVIEDAILEGLLLRSDVSARQLSFEFLEPVSRKNDALWDAAADREKRSRSLFAQNRLLQAVNEEVREELRSVRDAIGTAADVDWFTRIALKTLGAGLSGNGVQTVDMSGMSKAARHLLATALGNGEPGEALPDRIHYEVAPTPRDGILALTRTHPVVETLASLIMESALDDTIEGPGRRCGVIRTEAVERRTTLLLVRMRFHLVTRGRDGQARPLLAEDMATLAFSGSPEDPQWLDPDTVQGLLEAAPAGNIGADQARTQLARILERIDPILDHLNSVFDEHGLRLFDAHHRVRGATGSGVRALRVDPHKPADVLGLFLYLPAMGGGEQ